MRTKVLISVTDVGRFKSSLLTWCSGQDMACFMDSNNWQGSSKEVMAATGCLEKIIPSDNSFEALHSFHSEKKDWLFGHLGYGLKEETEGLSSGHLDGIGFPKMHFFRPEFVFLLQGNELAVLFDPSFSTEPKVRSLVEEIRRTEEKSQPAFAGKMAPLQNRITEGEYLDRVARIKQHIAQGDIYEMNYCLEFFAENVRVDPVQLFHELNQTSRSPFSAFYRMDERFLLCASPERFLKKTGNKIISQPIKGTSPRGKNESEDRTLKQALVADEKERSENVMIVDLVRNDLSHTCDKVTVEELFGVYSFAQWHQMISTVTGEMRKGVKFVDVIKNCFPMGSMTGAPKVRAMQIIEEYEITSRGLYSGAVGYITPDGDFDFNVVIRSIQYNRLAGYLSLMAGSAITASSSPEKEYEECLLKAKGMFRALSAAGSALEITDARTYA